MEDTKVRWFIIFNDKDTGDLDTVGRFEELSYEEALEFYQLKINDPQYDEVYLVKVEKENYN